MSFWLLDGFVFVWLVFAVVVLFGLGLFCLLGGSCLVHLTADWPGAWVPSCWFSLLFVLFVCLLFCLFLLLVPALSLASTVPPCLVALSPVQSSPLVLCASYFVLLSLGVLFVCFAVLCCFLAVYWMVIRCTLSRPWPWTGLCCSEQHWSSRRALCGTIWGARVQQRLLTWHSHDCILPCGRYFYSMGEWNALTEDCLEFVCASHLQCTAGPLETKTLWLHLNSFVERMYCTFFCLPRLRQLTCGELRVFELYLSLANVKSLGRHDDFNTRDCSCMTCTHALRIWCVERLSWSVIFGDYVPPVGGTATLHNIWTWCRIASSLTEWHTGDEGEELLRVFWENAACSLWLFPLIWICWLYRISAPWFGYRFHFHVPTCWGYYNSFGHS